MSQVLTQTPVPGTRWRIPVALSALCVSLAGVFFLAFFWPFRRDAVIKELENESDSKVTAGSFHGTYFPHPGCVLEQVIFQHNPKSGSPPLITVKRIRIESSFEGMFEGHVKRVLAEGLHLLIPPLGSEHFETPQRSPVVIDHLIADGAILEVASRRVGNPRLQFAFHAFTISDVGSYGPASFKATVPLENLDMPE